MNRASCLLRNLNRDAQVFRYRLRPIFPWTLDTALSAKLMSSASMAGRPCSSTGKSSHSLPSRSRRRRAERASPSTQTNETCQALPALRDKVMSEGGVAGHL